MRTPTWCVAAVLLSLAAPAAAQTVLSESQALALIADDSPRVRAIRAGVEIARAEALAPNRFPNPRLTFTRESVAGVTENILSVTQLLPITGRRGLETQAASTLAEAVGKRAEDEIRRARAELRVAYADLGAAQIREEELTRVRDRLSDLARVLARREDAGEGAGYDRVRAEREVVIVEESLASVRAERARAQATLSSFFTEAADITELKVELVDGPPQRAPLPPIDQLIATAQRVRGESAALQLEIDAAGLAESAADRRAIPEPELVVGRKSSNVAGGDVGTVVSVHASLPLFDQGNPERAIARARMSRAEAQLASFRAALAAEIAGLRRVVEERRAAATRHRASTASALQLERIAQVSYDAGERGILELLDAYRGGASARAEQAALDNAARRAELELELISGWEVQ